MDYLFLGLGLAIFGVFFGLFVFFKPALIIKFQIKSYARINWRMEPISMPKEIKNTKGLGFFLTLASLLGIVYIKFILG